MKYTVFLALLFLQLCFFIFSAQAQSPIYKSKKERQLAGPSPFQDEVDGKLPKRILFSDSLVLVLGGLPGSSQAPVHLLIIPRRRISSLNAAEETDEALLGHMLLVAKNIAKQQGISKSGYRLVVNTNEDAGQSAFHLHMHLLGGTVTGAMVDQAWRTVQRAKTAAVNNDYATPVTKDSLLIKLMGRWQYFSMQAGTEVNSILQFEPELNYQFLKETCREEIKDSTGKLISSYEGTASFKPAASQSYVAEWRDSKGNTAHLHSEGTGNSFVSYDKDKLQSHIIFLSDDRVEWTTFINDAGAAGKKVVLKRIY